MTTRSLILDLLGGGRRRAAGRQDHPRALWHRLGVANGSSTPMRVCGALFAAALAAPTIVAAQGICSDREPLYRLDGYDADWSGIKGVSSDGSLLVVVTESYPVVHLFDLADGSRRGSWGGSGQGPGEFQGTTGVALAGSRIHVLDGGQKRLSIFESSGDLVRTVTLEGGYYPRRLDRGGRNTLLFDLSEPMGDQRVIIARTVGGNANEEWLRQDTVVVYTRNTVDRLHLTAPEAPSMPSRRNYSGSGCSSP